MVVVSISPTGFFLFLFAVVFSFLQDASQVFLEGIAVSPEVASRTSLLAAKVHCTPRNSIRPYDQGLWQPLVSLNFWPAIKPLFLKGGTLGWGRLTSHQKGQDCLPSMNFQGQCESSGVCIYIYVFIYIYIYLFILYIFIHIYIYISLTSTKPAQDEVQPVGILRISSQLKVTDSAGWPSETPPAVDGWNPAPVYR